MDQMLKQSIRQWAVAFLCADVLFVLLVAFGCLRSPIDCGEGVGFSVYFWAQPLPHIEAIGKVVWWMVGWIEEFAPTLRYWLENVLFFLVTAVFHALVGGLVGALLSRYKIKKWISAVASIVFVFTVVFLLVRAESEKNFEAQTSTTLWALYDFSYGTSEYTGEPAYYMEHADANWMTDPNAPNGFRTTISDVTRSYSWAGLSELKNTRIFVIPYTEDGSPGDLVPLSAAKFAEAFAACVDTLVSCPYYGFATPMFFDVTISPDGIEEMRQRYVP